MLAIKFITNWNGKLDNKAFTTLRVHDPLRHRESYLYSVVVKNRFYTRAKILAVKTIKLNDITEFEARLDSGYSRAGFIRLIKKIYKSRAFLYDSQKFDLILFERLDSQVKLSM